MHARGHSRSSWALAALLVIAGEAEARADVVGPPPPSCPVGSVGDACHGGPFCRPRECQDDTECDGGATCQESKACIGGIQCGGLEGGNDPPLPTYEGACSDAGACTGSATCQTLKLCVAPGDTTGGGTAGTGGNTGGNTGTTATTTASTSNGTSDGSSASNSSGDTGGGKDGCAACSASGEPGGVALLLLAFARLLRRRRPAPR